MKISYVWNLYGWFVDILFGKKNQHEEFDSNIPLELIFRIWANTVTIGIIKGIYIYYLDFKIGFCTKNATFVVNKIYSVLFYSYSMPPWFLLWPYILFIPYP